MIHFTAFSGGLDTGVSRLGSTGGNVAAKKKRITGEIGYMGVFMDTEGNEIALHSRKQILSGSPERIATRIGKKPEIPDKAAESPAANSRRS